MKVFQHRFGKMPTSFPSQLEAFSIEDIQNVFGNLCNKELDEVKSKRLLDDERKRQDDERKRQDDERKRQDDERERLIAEKYALKREQEDDIIKIISEHFGFPNGHLSWGYKRIFIYKDMKWDFEMKILKNMPKTKQNTRNKPSTC